MLYVYLKVLKTGEERFINSYNTEVDAIEKIASCYKIDSRLGQLGDYYYFMKKR